MRDGSPNGLRFVGGDVRNWYFSSYTAARKIPDRRGENEVMMQQTQQTIRTMFLPVGPLERQQGHVAGIE